MYRSPLNASSYLSDEIFLKEQELVFRKIWIFAGIKSTLSKKNAFFTRKIGGVPVVFTTVDGEEVRAFENLCSHRQMPIQLEAFGNRSLTCPYHEWSFNSDGYLRGMPNAFKYQMRKDEKKCIRLREFRVCIVGNLIFVNLSPNPDSIDVQFEPAFLDLIKNASLHFDKTYAYTTFDANFNWKFNFENVMDFNHVPFVHSSSFGALVPKFEPSEEELVSDDEIIWDSLIKQENTPHIKELSYAAIGPVDLPDRWYSSKVRRYGESGHYYNWYIFPNINFASVAGEHFIIQQYEPISPSKMRYHLWIVTAERTNLGVDFTSLLKTLITEEKKVIDEDCVFLEALQRNLYVGAESAYHGAYEAPLIKVAKWYESHIVNGISGA